MRLASLIAALAFSVAAGAQPFPAKPVKIIVAFAPGGSSDVSARIVADRMADEWKQPLIVDNKPGAGTTIAAAFVAAAPADGYALLLLAPGSTAPASSVSGNLI